jgi:hypothetical protein
VHYFPVRKKTRCKKNAEKDSMTRDERAGTNVEGAAVGYHPDGKSKPFGDKLTAMQVLLLNVPARWTCALTT